MAGANPTLIVRVAATIAELRANLAEGRSQIETTTAAMQKLAASFSGDKLIQQANNVVAAIVQIGGVSKLTAAEQERVSSVLDRALEKYRVLGKEAPVGMQAIADATRRLNKDTTDALTPVESLALKFGAFVGSYLTAQALWHGAAAAFRTLTEFIGSSVESYAAAEAAQNKLVAGLRQHSLATPAVIAQYEALASTFQRTTIYADDEVVAMQALLTQVGGVMPSQMAGALKAATDLASGLGIDLHSATMLVAKAAAGHTETLGRYGITVSQAAVETRGFDAVLEAVNRQFGGAAAAEIETYTGRVKQVANAWDNVKEAIGKAVLTNPLAVAGLGQITEGLKNADAAATASNASLSTFMRTAANSELAGFAFAILEQEVDGWNAVAAAITRVNGLPTPFEKLAKDNALPAITAGLTLFNEQVAAHAKEVKAAADAEEAWNKILQEMDRTTFTLAMEHQKQWREEQHRTMDERNKTVVSGLQQIQAAEAATNDFIAKQSLDSLNYQILKIWQRVDEEEASFKGSEEQRRQYNAAVEALATEQAQSLRDTADAAAAATEAAAQRQVAAIKTVTGSYWEQIDAAAQAAGVTVVGHRPGEPGSELHAGATPNLSGTFSMQSGGATDPRILALVGAGYTLGEAMAVISGNAGHIVPQRRETGGPAVAGWPYVVGERRPELFVPDRNGTILPSVGSGGVPIIVQITINGSVLSDDYKIAKVVGDSIETKLRSLGFRMATGA